MTVLGEEDVLGLDVAADDPLLVGGGETFGDLVGDLEGALDGDRAASHERAEGLSLEQLGDGVVDALGFADVEEEEDVGVGKGGDGPRLALEERRAFGSSAR